MINSFRQQTYKIAKLKQYTQVNVFKNFSDLNTDYKKGAIVGAFDWQSKYFVDEKIRPNILNVNLIEFAKNKYRSYQEIEKLGITQLKTLVMVNPKHSSSYNGIEDIEKVFGDNSFVIKPNDSGLGKRIHITDKNHVEHLAIEKMWDEFILAQELIEGYSDIRVVICEPIGVVDCFSRLPANIITDGNRDYETRLDVDINSVKNLNPYVSKIRNHINKNYPSKYMFYSIDFYKLKNGKLVFGEINNNIGIKLVNHGALRSFCDEVSNK